MKKITKPLYRRLVTISLISFFYNIIWLFAFVISLFFSPYQLEIIWLSFLLAYLIFGQPLKDTFVFSIMKNFLGKIELKNYKILNQFNTAQSINQCIELLKMVIKSWNIAYVKIYLFYPSPCSIEIKKNLKQPIKNKEKTAIFEELLTYLETYTVGHNSSKFPPNIKNFLQRKEIYCVVPIMFREFLLGFLGLSNELDKETITVFEFAAQRIAILGQNKLLGDKINASKESEKEFRIARKIQLFLEMKKNIELKYFTLEKTIKGWEEKYFPLYYDAKTISTTMTTPKKPVTYVILCRPEKGLQKGTMLNLCSIQGYFISFCDAFLSLSSLSRKLHEVIQGELESSIHLGGFLIRIEGQNISCFHFGRELALEEDDHFVEVKNSVPLGAEQWKKFDIIRLKFKRHISFFINGYQLLSLGHREKPV